MKGLVGLKKKYIVFLSVLFIVFTIVFSGIMSEKDSVNKEEENIVRYEVGIEIERVENWFFSKYDVDVYIDDKYETSIENGSTEAFVLELDEGMHTLKIEHEEDDVYSEKIFSVKKNETFKFKVNCYSSEIEINEIIGTSETETTNYVATVEESSTDVNKITLPKDSDYYLGRDYETVENEFTKLGFTNIEFQTVDDNEFYDEDGEVCSINIDGKNFVKGDVFNKDSKIYIEYLSVDDEEESYTLFYSNNTREEAIKGNSGAFAYRSRGGSYDLYWIVDFDEGYVYNFSDEDTWCDRLKIESGDLNTNVKITYHDGTDIWSYKLHFKYANAPETLVMIDQNGFDYYYETTDLQDALSLKDSKKISDY